MSEYETPRPLPATPYSDPQAVADNATTFGKLLNENGNQTTYNGTVLKSIKESIDSVTDAAEVAIPSIISDAEKQIATAIAAAGYQIAGDFSDATKAAITSDNQVYTSKSISGQEDAIWRTNQLLPYTPTGSDPSSAPEIGKWLAVAVGELKTIARSLNLLDSDVIYSSDTATVLDDKKAIYDISAQKSWVLPNIGAGETIVSIASNTLTTNANTYKLIPANATYEEKVSRFDQLQTSPPTQPFADSPRPVFTLFEAANFDLTYLLYPCKSGDKSVLEIYKEGAVAPSDAFNVGGSANHRVTVSFEILTAIAANFNPFAKTSGVLNTTAVDATNWGLAVGAPTTFAGSGAYSNGANDFITKNTWNIPNGESVEFASRSTSEILFYKSPTSSTAVNIYTDVGGTYALTHTVDLSGSTGAFRYTVETGTRVRIENTEASNCYVIGVDVDNIHNANINKSYDSVQYWRSADYWIGPSEGANDFAFKNHDGKFFGSFHGGHSAETVTLNVDGEEYTDVDIVTGEFKYGKSATLTSSSTLTSTVSAYQCKTQVTLFDGGHRIYCDVNTVDPSALDEMFMGMTVAATRFNTVINPINIGMSALAVNDEVELGDVSYAMQYDKAKRQSVRTDVTKFDHRYSSKDGAYIQKRANDYKFYYNPLEDANEYTHGAKFEIYHQFYS